MKSVSTLVIAGVAVLAMAVPVSALDLLGGIVKIGKDSSSKNEIVSIDDNDGGTSIGLLGKNGASVNLPLKVPVNTNVKVPGVASITTGDTSNGGVTIIVDPGNGGGGGGVQPRINNAIDGLGNNLGNNLGNSLPGNLSSKLQWLLQMLGERNHLALSNGRAVCLNSFGVGELSGIIKRSEWDEMQQVIANYAQDIYMARKLLAACTNAQQRAQLSIGDVNRVIGIDFSADGRPVLYML